MGLMKLLTGPTREEMGMPPKSEGPIPHAIDPPIPYKDGSAVAQWPVEAKETRLRDRIHSVLLLGVPLAVLVVGLVVSLTK